MKPLTKEALVACIRQYREHMERIGGDAGNLDAACLADLILEELAPVQAGLTPGVSAMRGHPRIWLQWHADDTTWCKDRQNDDDIEYIRADLAQPRRELLDRQVKP